MNKKQKILLYVLITLFAIVGIPIVINELYKIDNGYITLWGASEMLSYYGTILGAGATILAVILTIRFTRQQINHEYFISKEKLKWEKIDNLFQEHFKKIMPTEIIQIYYPYEKITKPIPYIEKIKIKIIEIKTSPEWIKSYINPVEYEKISDYVNVLETFDADICNICEKIIEYLAQIVKNELYVQVQKTIDEQKEKLSDEELENYKKILMNNPYVKPEEVFESIDKCTRELLAIQEKKFPNLLNSKRDIFNNIYDEINKNNK